MSVSLQELAKETVDQYYSMREDQRQFIVDLTNSNPETKWSRFELMKALILYNKAMELKCNLSDSKLDSFVVQIDNYGVQLTKFLQKFDSNLRESV
jgi:hypothetical protein